METVVRCIAYHSSDYNDSLGTVVMPPANKQLNELTLAKTVGVSYVLQTTVI